MVTGNNEEDNGMEESNVIELLDKMMEELGGTISDNVVTITAELIKRSCGVVLSDAQVQQCIDVCQNAKFEDKTFFEQLLDNNGINKAKIEKIDKCAKVIANIDDYISLCENIYAVADIVKKYIEGKDVSADYALSKVLNTLSDAVGLFTSCNLVSSILSLGADILDKGAELVQQRADYYAELDAILDEVMKGTSTAEQDKQVRDMYKVVKDFENNGSLEAIKLYDAIMNDYGWMFTLVGVDMTELNRYNVELDKIESAYITMNSKMQEVERIDRNSDGIITPEEIQINVAEVKTSEKTQKYDPLILDLNKNGKYTSDAVNGVHFDYSGDGFAERTAWVEDGDGLLVYDKNGNGIIDDGNELFGDKTVMQDGTVATNGFSALEDFDSNGDGKINSDDEQFELLQVWVDSNNDGVSQQDELFSLCDLGIKELSLSVATYNKVDENGNIIGRKSSVTYEDGSVGEMAELDLEIISEDTVLKSDIEICDEIKNSYPQLIASGNMLNLHQAMSVDEELNKMVNEFVNSNDMTQLEELVDQIIVRWTHTEDVVEGSRGSYVNAGELAIIEKFYGKEFVGLNGKNPNNTAGPILTKVYKQLRNDIFMSMLGQSILKDYCDATVIRENFISGEKRIDYTNVFLPRI